MYNPVTATVSMPGLFGIVGAAIPSTILASVVYLLLASLFLVPRQIGFPAVPGVARRRAPGVVAEPRIVTAESDVAL
jgi:hypothetical protein